ncbi:MAG: hypothetical protein IPI67_35805 [Myxococcales bacterium]|nr:hypothetical protein [Myxococcales bacterium]
MVRRTLLLAIPFGCLLASPAAKGQDAVPTEAFPPVPVEDAGAPAQPDSGAPLLPPPLPPQPPRPVPPSPGSEVVAPSRPAYPQVMWRPPAQPPWEYSSAPIKPKRRWYGGQTLIADGASLGAIFAGGAAESSELAVFGLLGMFFAAPIVHAAHGHAGKPFASLGLRVGLPIVGGFVGCAADDSDGMFGCLGGAAAGMFLGLVAASVLDASVIAYEDVPPQRAKRTPAVGVTASVVWLRDRGTLGVSGWF